MRFPRTMDKKPGERGKTQHLFETLGKLTAGAVIILGTAWAIVKPRCLP